MVFAQAVLGAGGPDATGATASSKGSRGMDGPPPRWLAHSRGKLVLAVGKGPQCLTLRASPQGCVSVLTTQLLASLRGNNPTPCQVEIISFMI